MWQTSITVPQTCSRTQTYLFLEFFYAAALQNNFLERPQLHCSGAPSPGQNGQLWHGLHLLWFWGKDRNIHFYSIGQSHWDQIFFKRDLWTKKNNNTFLQLRKHRSKLVICLQYSTWTCFVQVHWGQEIQPMLKRPVTWHCTYCI